MLQKSGWAVEICKSLSKWWDICHVNSYRMSPINKSKSFCVSLLLGVLTTPSSGRVVRSSPQATHVFMWWSWCSSAGRRDNQVKQPNHFTSLKTKVRFCNASLRSCKFICCWRRMPCWPPKETIPQFLNDFGFSGVMSGLLCKKSSCKSCRIVLLQVSFFWKMAISSKPRSW